MKINGSILLFDHVKGFEVLLNSNCVVKIYIEAYTIGNTYHRIYFLNIIYVDGADRTTAGEEREITAALESFVYLNR